MDETPIYLDHVPTNTVEKIGDKTVNIKTLGQEKTRASLLLAISGIIVISLLFY